MTAFFYNKVLTIAHRLQLIFCTFITSKKSGHNER